MSQLAIPITTINTMAIIGTMDMTDTIDTVRIFFRKKCNLIYHLKSSNLLGHPNAVHTTAKPSLLEILRNAFSNMLLFVSNSVSYLSTGVSRASRQLQVVGICLVFSWHFFLKISRTYILMICLYCRVGSPQLLMLWQL